MEELNLTEEQIKELTKIAYETIHKTRKRKLKLNWEWGLERREFDFGDCYYFYIKIDYSKPCYCSYSGQENIVINSKNEVVSFEEMKEMLGDLRVYNDSHQQVRENEMRKNKWSFIPIYKG